ncbi:uncharacterized protein TNCV_4764961 [Trichonephila clavipes]|nr:uncharacterized protein TNCV_4764961 [Trichonephila clavipes]
MLMTKHGMIERVNEKIRENIMSHGMQDGAPAHWHLSVRDWSNITVPNQWIDRKVPPDKACIAWPPRSADLTPCDFYQTGLKKDCVYVPLLPADLSD